MQHLAGVLPLLNLSVGLLEEELIDSSFLMHAQSVCLNCRVDVLPDEDLVEFRMYHNADWMTQNQSLVSSRSLFRKVTSWE
jgi:hypothetical protein